MLFPQLCRDDSATACPVSSITSFSRYYSLSHSLSAKGSLEHRPASPLLLSLFALSDSSSSNPILSLVSYDNEEFLMQGFPLLQMIKHCPQNFPWSFKEFFQEFSVERNETIALRCINLWLSSKLSCTSFATILKWRHSSPNLDYAVKFIGRGWNGNFKARFRGENEAESKNSFWSSYLWVIEIPKL